MLYPGKPLPTCHHATLQAFEFRVASLSSRHARSPSRSCLRRLISCMVNTRGVRASQYQQREIKRAAKGNALPVSIQKMIPCCRSLYVEFLCIQSDAKRRFCNADSRVQIPQEQSQGSEVNEVSLIRVSLHEFSFSLIRNNGPWSEHGHIRRASEE